MRPPDTAYRPDRRRLLLAGATAMAAFASGRARAQNGPTVDLALVLAADCSGSVLTDHYVLQQRGYADAFRDPAVIRAIRSGINGAIAVCYFQWSGFSLQTLGIPWTLLASPADIASFAGTIEHAERTLYGGGTAPAGAIRYGHELLDRVIAGERAVTATRRVIDISGDGRTNIGPPPSGEREAAIRKGITINGLPILHMEPDIDDYYSSEIIGGTGAFIVPARDFNAFREAIRRKLILEIAGTHPVPV